jgi:hypothetical protein
MLLNSFKTFDTKYKTKHYFFQTTIFAGCSFKKYYSRPNENLSNLVTVMQILPGFFLPLFDISEF